MNLPFENKDTYPAGRGDRAPEEARHLSIPKEVASMEVKVYSTPTCPWCTKVKEYLKGKGVTFTSVDVSQDRDAARDMVARTGQMGVPVIDIDGTFIIGFDKGALDAKLAEKGH